MTFLNGTPDSPEEAVFQSFGAENTEALRGFNRDMNKTVLSKNATVISSKQELIEELTTGTNDFLFIVAHCDGENVFFGSSVLSIADLKSLPTRLGRRKVRMAVLFSCMTGDIYHSMPFANDAKTFAELLIEKKYFDYVIAPPGTINGDDVLRMTEIIDKHPVLELNKQFTKLLDKGEMMGLAKIRALTKAWMTRNGSLPNNPMPQTYPEWRSE